MTVLARFSGGRVLLHLLAMVGDRRVRFHAAGIIRELPWVAEAKVLLARACVRLIDALVLYLARPIKHSYRQPGADPRSLANVLNRGDVLLSHGNTRGAALVRCITRSPWSHVAMYVGPLEDRPDPLCIVEADICGRCPVNTALRVERVTGSCIATHWPERYGSTPTCRVAGKPNRQRV